MSQLPPTVVIAGTHSGAGKTTIATGIIAALTRRGLRVQPFKAGPDYIDPTYHSRAAGRPSRNLDAWMLPANAIRELFSRAAAGCDVAIIEGVMGLYDGRSGDSDEGSTAALARLLGAPVILVVDAAAMARSAAAIVLGFQQFDPAVRIAGVILNNVAGERHAQMAAAPISAATGLPVLGYLPREPDVTLPERHLGLIPEGEGAAAAGYFDRLASLVESRLDLDFLLRIGHDIEQKHDDEVSLFPSHPVPGRAGIAVAMDRAFSFYYQDSLDLLEAWGAELLPFSPLEDTGLPKGSSGVYLGGGFPEVYAAELAANRAMPAALRKAAAAGTPVYGECGGLMYLGESITDFEGRVHQMAGLVPLRSSMQGRRLSLGYRTVRARQSTPLMPAGQTVRGHEFHWSDLDSAPPSGTAAYDILEQSGRSEGFASRNLLASYVHLHFGADPTLAPGFVDSCSKA
jgi:cobyrinic acid a,c-diamide synthase